MAVMLAGCETDRLKVDVQGIEAEVMIERVDSIWFNASAITFREEHPRLLSEYGDLYRLYVEELLQLSDANDSDLFAYVRQFTTHPDISEVHSEVATAFPDLINEEHALEEAWKHYLYYFPDRSIPQHMSYISGFGSSFAMTQTGVGISLEKFLGANCKFYEYLQLPLYQRQRMTRQHLVPWLMKNWVETEFEMGIERPTLLDDIVHNGKILYAMEALMPGTPDSLFIGYSSEQMEWAKTHERFVWAHFVDKQLLFNTDAKTISKFTIDGPFTVDLAKESPARMGHYIGWQIIRAYMQHQEIVDLDALFAEKDARTILTMSKYKP